MRAKFKSVALSAVMMAALVAAGAASAQIAVGGGATLPELLYDDLLPSGIGLTNFSYTGTGSGAGKTAFISNNASAFKNESVVGTPNWPATGQSVHFAGSDSALIQSELDAYNANAAGTTGWGPMIQVPAVATSVLIPYKRAGIADLNLSGAKMCAIFSNKTGGQTWGQVRGTADTTTVNVVYRSDNSGTTELLSRYLVAACPGSGFKVSNNFATVVGSALSPANVIPSNWVSANGSGGVKTALTTDARVGYLSPDPDYTGTNNAVVAKINGVLPAASSIRNALAKQVLPTGAANNPLNWVPAYVMPAAGTEYPIFGTTNLLLNQCYKDAAIQTKVKNLLTGLTGTTYDGLIETDPVNNHNFVVIPNGTSPGTPPAANNNWKAAIAANFLTATSPLSIGFAGVCNGKGRP
ncbi:substrate-binding domain-containing protein [Acidovorax cavernicola]|uniref:Protein disulfide reductase n=1 Tax=Acidovorax cavernicola TaxID=1675792 RepID=A0A9X8D9E1_9BURK|nr:substrate-binding domain-containing protein [Acidovorax cavernicola]RIX85266.1 protein disulfide reductase [Acidovorax cavernicola]